MRRSPRRARETVIGLVALVLLGATLVAAAAVALRRVRTAVESDRHSTLAGRQAAERRKTEQAFHVVSSLASAVDSLARLKVGAAHPVVPAVVPPLPTEFASPTACMLSYLPELEVPSGSLDFVCEETDLWSLEWQVRAHLSGKVGDGAHLWSRLGPYAMAALASMRKGCCVDPPYLQAKVPGLWCGILRDTVRDFQAVPARATISEFEHRMKCLEGRGMRLPAHFAEVTPDSARSAFDDFLAIARRRETHAAARPAAPEGPP